MMTPACAEGAHARCRANQMGCPCGCHALNLPKSGGKTKKRWGAAARSIVSGTPWGQVTKPPAPPDPKPRERKIIS